MAPRIYRKYININCLATIVVHHKCHIVLYYIICVVPRITTLHTLQYQIEHVSFLPLIKVIEWGFIVYNINNVINNYHTLQLTNCLIQYM